MSEDTPPVRPQMGPAGKSFLARIRRRPSSEEEPEGSLWHARARAGFDRFQEKLKLRRRQKQPKPDQAKSNELVAEMAAGVPAAILAASTFQRDAQGRKRIPILPEQLSVRFIRMQDGVELADATTGQRHPEFHIQIEYGKGAARRTWVVVRSLRALATLHVAYKTELGKQRVSFVPHDSRIKLPEFPSSAFPYLRALRAVAWARELQGLKENDEPQPPSPDRTATDPSNIPTGRPSKTFRRISTYSDNLFGASGRDTKKAGFEKKQRQVLEKWLQDMIKYLMYKPQINRLCRFLELSVPGMRLAAEGDYHGKEGPLMLTSDTTKDFRKSWSPGRVRERYHPKWWSVRGSYLLCTESAEEVNIKDVILMDPSFLGRMTRPKGHARDKSGKELVIAVGKKTRHPQRHTLKVKNTERKITLRATSATVARQFEESMKHVAQSTIWARKHRFDSFAPMHSNVFVLPLVDGQAYMWNVSRAISQAQDVIFLHGWWFSPEMWLRRPACISHFWRLDRLLMRKAEEGVKIFIIMYRNVDSAIPIDSQHSKTYLQKIHPNIIVQRSPNQFRQNTFFWAHHEKLCVVDHNICFVGGIDLCFGRFDDPKHRMADDKPTGYEDEILPKTLDNCQTWPGKDYSNPRVKDFYELDRPLDEMYDRAKVARMPWHDISLQLVGKPARDLSRHFVQRWNFILRQRKPTRPTPLLCPPPEWNQKDLDHLGLNGTCEVQLLRSCSTWSMGVQKTEHSIMNAYVDAIQHSEHFIYIENQFFISTTQFGTHKILNGIGDALVERIIRAHENNEAWKAIVMIPLMPGFEGGVDEKDGTSVRLIMQCQFRSICRGENSIFGRLRESGIQPTDYIQFYSLRAWDTLGPNKTLTTEQLYIHAKCMIVDDQIVICGSANINERSMLGDRDSEVACIVRDTDMIQSTMNGKPYEVGLFPHTLRVRLMREHLGINIEDMPEEKFFYDEDEQGSIPPEKEEANDGSASEHSDEDDGGQGFVHNTLYPTANGAPPEDMPSSGIARSGSLRRLVEGNRSRSGSLRRIADGSNLSRTESVEHLDLPPYRYPLVRTSSFDLGLPMRSELPPLPITDDTDIGGPALLHSPTVHADIMALGPKIANMKRPQVSADCMKDPLNDDFYSGIWQTVAENNTTLFRTVFHCQPDNEVRSWEQYNEFNARLEEFQESQAVAQNTQVRQRGRSTTTRSRSASADDRSTAAIAVAAAAAAAAAATSHEKASPILPKVIAEQLLGMVQGHLIIWPYDWLAKEESGWSAPLDGLAPLEIYN